MNLLIKLLISIIVLILPFDVYANNHHDNIDHYRIITEDYPPYNFINDKNELTGFSVEIWGLVSKELKSKHKTKNIEILSWAKGYDLALKNSNVMLFTMSRTNEREHLFKWVGPVISSKISLMGRKDRNFKLDSLKDINKYKIGAVRSDVGEAFLLSNNVSKKNITSVLHMDQNIKKLLTGRIDFIAADEDVFKAMLQEKGEDYSEYKVVYNLTDVELYYVFNKNASDKLVDQVQFALDNVRKSKDYDKLIAKYFD